LNRRDAEAQRGIFLLCVFLIFREGSIEAQRRRGAEKNFTFLRFCVFKEKQYWTAETQKRREEI
jgi:hypothetical protein